MENYSTRIKFLQIPIDSLTLTDTIKIIDNAIKKNKLIQHVVVNAGKIVAMQKDKKLYNCIVSSDLINADGQSIVWGARFLGLQLPERVTGIDLMEEVIKLAATNKYKCYFLGAHEHTVEKVINNYSIKYGPEIIAGYRNGYFNKYEEKQIAKNISESGAQILFVAMNSPQKEIFVNDYKTYFNNLNFVMGVGGSFDVVAGITKRAPKLFQKIGLEWLFRLIQEPRRMWKRYLIGNSIFIFLILKEKFRQLTII